MVKKILKNAGIGFLLGTTVWILIMFFMGKEVPAAADLIERTGSLRAAMVWQYVLSGLYGALCMGSVFIYDSDRLSMAAASLIHGSLCIIPFIPISYFLCWAGGIAGSLILAGIQLIVYFIIWLIMYLNYRKEVKALNDMQRQSKNTDRGEETK